MYAALIVRFMEFAIFNTNLGGADDYSMQQNITFCWSRFCGKLGTLERVKMKLLGLMLAVLRNKGRSKMWGFLGEGLLSNLALAFLRIEATSYMLFAF